MHRFAFLRSRNVAFYEILPGFTRLYDGTGKRGFLSFVVHSIGTSFFLVGGACPLANRLLRKKIRDARTWNASSIFSADSMVPSMSSMIFANLIFRLIGRFCVASYDRARPPSKQQNATCTCTTKAIERCARLDGRMLVAATFVAGSLRAMFNSETMRIALCISERFCFRPILRHVDLDRRYTRSRPRVILDRIGGSTILRHDRS